MILLLLSSACTEPCLVGDDPSDSAETALSGDDFALDVTAEISEYVHTVVIVRWSTAEPTTGYVEFGPDDEYGQTTLTTAEGTEHEVLLLGQPADTLVHFRVVIDTAAGEAPTHDYEITTLSLPSGIPVPIVSGAVTGQWSYQVLPMQGTALFVTIIDDKGRIIWYYEPQNGGNLMRALLTHDRKSVLLGHAGAQGHLEDGILEWISLDGGTVTTADVPNFDHDLTELPDGTVALIMLEDRGHEDGSPWAADRIMELAPDGTMTQVFNAWDQLDPTGLEELSNWTHANAIDYVESEDCYYLSMKEIGTLAKIPRSTGVPEWMINGRFNQFEFIDGAVPGEMQHQFEVLGDGHLLLFDNGKPERGYSRAVELQLDFNAMTASQLWEYIRVPPVYVYAKGDVSRFADDSTQVTWSTSGEIQLVDAGGGLLWQLNLPLGNATTFVQTVTSLYEDR